MNDLANQLQDILTRLEDLNDLNRQYHKRDAITVLKATTEFFERLDADLDVIDLVVKELRKLGVRTA